jgi:recombination protein RecA
MEHALDLKYAAAIGISVPDLVLSQPDYAEAALDIAEALIHSAQLGVVVIDSVASLVPKAELEGEIGDAHVGRQSRLMSQALRMITPSLGQTLVIFINQLRTSIGGYGAPEITPGGKALKYYAAIRLDIRRVETLQDGDGNRVKVKVVKNKVASPFKVAEFDVYFGSGIDRLGSLVEAALAVGVLDKSGTWIRYNGESIGQGRVNARNWLADHPEAAREIEEKVHA